ncbi:MAG: hypothetical protein JXL80_01095, partial [Planctomycetes bacterium]|nr:hypothetical protein [Planctomycetota bacterium]
MQRAVIGWICTACLLAVVGAAAADSAQYQVSASADDTSALSGTNLYTSGVVYTPYSNTDRRAFWRWPISIPAGATITSATLQIRSDGSAGDANASTMRLQLVDSDSCPSFTSNPYGASVTAAYVDWTLPGTWTANAWYESPDLSSLVQLFIDRGGYTSGNYLGLRGEQVSGLWKRSYQYDNAAANAAVLTIGYTTGANEPPVADAGEDQYPEDADGNNSETVTLDGSGSSDSDGTIVSYLWKEGTTQIATGQTAQVSLAVGTHTITLAVEDDDGATADDTVTVTVMEADVVETTFTLELSVDDASATTAESGAYNAKLYTPHSSDSQRSFWRWACYIPVGATIREAYLKVMSDGAAGDSNASTMRLQLVDSDDCEDFSSNPFSRSVTANYEDWQVPATWTTDQWYTSTDVSSIVQEFIDRAGYEFGNYLGLRGVNASGLWKRAYAFDYGDNTSGAELEVHYAGGQAIVELLMADPEVRIAQPIYCWLFNARSGDTLRAKLDGDVIYQKAGPLDDEEAFLADYTELEAGEHTLLVEVLNGAGQARTSASRTWTTLHDGIPYVGINEYNAICVDGEPFFPVTPFILREDNFSGPVGDAINCTFGVGWYAVQNIANWQDYIDESWEEGWYAAGPIRWDGLDYGDASNADTDKLVDYVQACWDYSPGLLAWSWIDEPDLY